MRLFISNIIKFLLLVAVLWVSYVSVLLLILNFAPQKTNLYHNSKPLLNKKKFILGNSHPQCAINDTLLNQNYLNLSRSGEPLFYTTIKAQNLINKLKADTLIIEFENSAVYCISWVLDDDQLLDKYKRYFCLMTAKQHLFMFKNNFKKSLKTLFYLKPKDVLNYNSIDGGNRYLVRDFDSTKLNNFQIDRYNYIQKKYSSETQYANFESLKNLISNNPSTYFIITRMPLHKKYNFFQNSVYFSYVNELAKYRNCRYIDFNQFTALPDSCFGDDEHLNYKGAKIFTPIFDSLLNKLIVSK